MKIGLSFPTRRCLKPKIIALVLVQFTINSLSVNQLLMLLIISSCDPSKESFNAQLVFVFFLFVFFINSSGSAAQESRIHCKMIFLGVDFKFAEVDS